MHRIECAAREEPFLNVIEVASHLVQPPLQAMKTIVEAKSDIPSNSNDGWSAKSLSAPLSVVRDRRRVVGGTGKAAAATSLSEDCKWKWSDGGLVITTCFFDGSGTEGATQPVSTEFFYTELPILGIWFNLFVIEI